MPLILDAPANPNDNSVSPFYGSINPFYGSINPFYGSINPFYGSISPFWGDITPFWGDITPFYGSINPFYGSINPFWGSITPFGNNAFWPTVMPYWQNAGPQWGQINTLWNQLQSSNATDYSQLQRQLQQFLGQASSFWNGAVEKYTNKDFSAGFADDMLAKYGIDPNDAASLANVSVQTRSAFFLNFYDGLMNFTGVDHVDWWMPAVNWSPELTQTQGSTGRAIVGIIDSTFNGAANDVANVNFIGGYNLYVNQHGGAVASLIAAQHDGTGVMGIAPNAQINLYNPFDQTGTANWNDVSTGIAKLYASGAHVVNASLGTPGLAFSQEWVNILSGPLLSPRAHDLVIVKAAGNEGQVQTQNIPWLLGLSAPNNILIVGSVGPTGQISSFSNTPGEACLTVLGICLEQNKLKYRYLVAPGELMLVSDGNGGVTRMSGTSFAAPLVTGTVALLDDRWPWLQSHADETVQIILRSAKDLGAPGVDPVYGWGELDVTAAQSPLSFDNLVVYQPFTYNGKALSAFSTLLPNWSTRQLKSAALNPGQLSLWQKQGAYIVAFENIGTTYRDFTIPLSTLLVGKNQKTSNGDNPFQSYLYQRLIDWANGNSLAFNAHSVAFDNAGWRMNLTATVASADEVRHGSLPFHSEFVATNPSLGLALRFGEGDGAHGLTGENGFDFRSDFDPSTGGVNPVLGLASGGAYAQGAFTVADNLHFTVGITQKSDGHNIADPTFGKLKEMPLPTQVASAATMGFDYTPARGVTLNLAYTDLSEANGLLGAQGAGLFTLGAARTAATTVGATFDLGDGYAVAGSATAAHTRSAGFGTSTLTLQDGGLDSTAYEIVASKSGLAREGDLLRISFAQPLHVESGALQYSSLQVVDRDAGTLGALNETWSLSGVREYRAEALYDMPVFEDRAHVAGFSLVDINPQGRAVGTVAVTTGLQFRMDF
ncbi:MAG: S8 family serine peptidase [Proteobacteria bacterium]|nr:S8 family serine peptidase [Pseudomonadota bacterium]